MAYNVNPTPQQGSGAYGLVPGAVDAVTPNMSTYYGLGSAAQVAMPDPYGDLSKIIPGLGSTNSKIMSNINSQLAGVVPQDVSNSVRDSAAAWGVNNGMTGSGIGTNLGLKDLGLTSIGLQQQGLTNYNSYIPTVSSTQTVSPSTQAQIGEFNAGAQNSVASQNASAQNQNSQFNATAGNNANALNASIAQSNATNAAMPNPQSAFEKQQELYNQYLQRMGGGNRVSIAPAGGGFSGAGYGGGSMFQQADNTAASNYYNLIGNDMANNSGYYVTGT